MIYVSCSDSVGAGSTDSLSSPTRLTKLSKNVCERFGGGSPERQIELRSQLESLKLYYSCLADSRRMLESQRVPLCMIFSLIPAHFNITLLFKLDLEHHFNTVPD